MKTQNLKKNYSRLTFGVVMLAIIVFAAVCWHSVEEILYLKSFFPKQFSVQEAYYSASIELIKVVIILVAIGIYYVYKSFKGYEE